MGAKLTGPDVVIHSDEEPIDPLKHKPFVGQVKHILFQRDRDFLLVNRGAYYS